MSANVLSYLRRNGWHEVGRGAFGALWSLGDGAQADAGDAPTLAVANRLEIDSFEYESVVSRLALNAERSIEAMSRALEAEFLDGQNYRVADKFLVDDSALLNGATVVLNSARKLMRAAATTSRKPRSRIGANYSAPGDELAKKARLAHTRHGSFILPVVMPVEPLSVESNHLQDDLGPIEPGERAVTRTLATALAALDSIAVKPDKEPGPDDIANLVASGVSKELVVAVREIVVNAGVEAFDVSFEWAPALPEPKNTPARVLINDEASVLLNRVVETLGKLKPEPDASVSGQIVRIHYVQDDPMGEIAVRTDRGSRNADVEVTVTSAVVHQAYEWARDHRPVLVRGRLERIPGKPLSIPLPTDVIPVDMLFAGGTVQQANDL